MSPALKRKVGTQAGGPDSKKPKMAQGNIMSFFGPPKVTPASGSSASSSSAAGAAAAAPEQAAGAGPKFDKAKWVASLTDEQRGLLKLEIDTLHESWLALLKEEIVTREFLELKRFLDREYSAGKTIFPPKEDFYSWFVSPCPPPYPLMLPICHLLTCNPPQVPPHPLPHSQDRHPRPRPVPQPQPSPRP